MEEILTICEKCRYCKKTHNNALTTYYTLAAKPVAPTLLDIVQCRKVRLELKSWNQTNCGSTYFFIFGDIICHYYRFQGFKIEEAIV